MPSDFRKIVCPSCKAEISLDEAFTHQLEEAARTQIAAEQGAKDAEFQRREQAIATREKALDKTVTERTDKARIAVEKEIKERLAKEKEGEINLLTEQLREKDKSLDEARTLELKARQDRARLEDEKKAFELEKQRQLDAERERIRSDARKAAEDEMHLKMLEKDKQLADARKMNQDLERKLQQGSQQTQGEVLELELEGLLRAAFPMDRIESVPKGVNGADVIQHVVSSSGADCGSIVWEAKHTKGWSEPWIQKLKEDQRKVGSEIAVIASDVLPKDAKDFEFREGVWITDYKLSVPLASTLRDQLIKVAVIKQSSIGKNQKLEVLYAYLSSTEFRHKIEAIVEAFKGMKEDLEKEKMIMAKAWAKREKQIQQVTLNTVGMYGDLEGLLGSAIQPIPALEASEEPDEEE
jgi:hypothetical protein